MQVTELDIEDVRPYDGNPRDNSGAVDVIAESIRNYGFRQPIVVDRDHVIVCGHTRWEAMRRLGMRKIPCIVADDLTPEQCMAYRLDDNKSAEYSRWDFSKLTEELKCLDEHGYDMSTLAFTASELESLMSADDEAIHDDDGDGNGSDGEENGESAGGYDVRELGCVTAVLADTTDAHAVEAALDGKSPSVVMYSLLMLPEGLSDRFAIEEHIVRNVERIADMSAPGTPFYAIADELTLGPAISSMSSMGIEVHGSIVLRLASPIRLGESMYDRGHVSMVYGWRNGKIPAFESRGAVSTPKCTHPDWCHCPPECVTHTIPRHCGKDGVVANPLGGSGDIAVICHRFGQRCVSFYDDLDTFRAVCGRIVSNVP